MTDLDPSGIMEIGAGYWRSKVLLSAVGLGLFTELAKAPLSRAEIQDALGLQPRPAADFLDGPNGIGLSPNGERLYVAETQVGRIWYWHLDGPGKIAADADGEYHPGKLLYGAPGYRLFDSMAVDGDGWVCQATLIEGGITQISPDAKTVEAISLSDPMITNICFGGPDRRTAFITCSGTGHLIAVDWPRPGGRLAFL
jgi:gluconolactonase